MKFRSSAKSFPHAQGTLQERINHPARFVHNLPRELGLEMGALLEPLSVAIHANRRAQLRPGVKVLVFGAGAVGLLIAAVVGMQVEGARVVIADIDKGRVGFAVKNGFAHQGFDVPRRRGTTTEEEIVIARATAEEIAKIEVEGEVLGQVDAVFECTDVPSCLQTSIYATKAGGGSCSSGWAHPCRHFQYRLLR
jgi:L-iditol 2-dehydrogenase